MRLPTGTAYINAVLPVRHLSRPRPLFLTPPYPPPPLYACCPPPLPPGPSLSYRQVLAFHPALLAQLFIMLAHVQALVTGLTVGGFEVNPTDVFRRYAIASLGPYLLLGAGYFVVTLSGLFAAWLFLPVALFAAVFVVLTSKAALVVRRAVEAEQMPAAIKRILSPFAESES